MPVFRGLGNRLLRRAMEQYSSVDLDFDGADGDNLEKHISLRRFLSIFDACDPRSLANEPYDYDLCEALDGENWRRGNSRWKKIRLSDKVVGDIADAIASEMKIDRDTVLFDLPDYFRSSSLMDPLSEIWSKHWNALWYSYVMGEWDIHFEVEGEDGLSISFNGWESDGQNPYAKDKGCTLYFRIREMIENAEKFVNEIDDGGFDRWFRARVPFYFDADDLYTDFSSYVGDSDSGSEVIESIEKEIERFLGTDEIEDPNQMLLPFPG